MQSVENKLKRKGKRMITKLFKKSMHREPNSNEMEAMEGLLGGLAEGTIDINDLMDKAKETDKLIKEKKANIEG